jgi:hypothetical protein
MERKSFGSESKIKHKPKKLKGFKEKSCDVIETFKYYLLDQILLRHPYRLDMYCWLDIWLVYEFSGRAINGYNHLRHHLLRLQIAVYHQGGKII